MSYIIKRVEFALYLTYISTSWILSTLLQNNFTLDVTPTSSLLYSIVQYSPMLTIWMIMLFMLHTFWNRLNSISSKCRIAHWWQIYSKPLKLISIVVKKIFIKLETLCLCWPCTAIETIYNAEINVSINFWCATMVYTACYTHISKPLSTLLTSLNLWRSS